jgi:hypothetical protein
LCNGEIGAGLFSLFFDLLRRAQSVLFQSSSVASSDADFFFLSPQARLSILPRRSFEPTSVSFFKRFLFDAKLHDTAIQLVEFFGL